MIMNINFYIFCTFILGAVVSGTAVILFYRRKPVSIDLLNLFNESANTVVKQVRQEAKSHYLEAQKICVEFDNERKDADIKMKTSIRYTKNLRVVVYDFLMDEDFTLPANPTEKQMKRLAQLDTMRACCIELNKIDNDTTDWSPIPKKQVAKNGSKEATQS